MDPSFAWQASRREAQAAATSAEQEAEAHHAAVREAEALRARLALAESVSSSRASDKGAAGGMQAPVRDAGGEHLRHVQAMLGMSDDELGAILG